MYRGLSVNSNLISCPSNISVYREMEENRKDTVDKTENSVAEGNKPNDKMNTDNSDITKIAKERIIQDNDAKKREHAMAYRYKLYSKYNNAEWITRWNSLYLKLANFNKKLLPGIFECYA